MAKKYNFSVTYPTAPGFTETMQVVEGDSFDEVIRIVERAVKERLETINVRYRQESSKVPEIKIEVTPGLIPPTVNPNQVLPDMVKTYSDHEMKNEVPNNIPTTSSKQPA